EYNGQGYVFSLLQRPPAPTLELLAEYLTVKYQDVIAQRDFVTHILGRMSVLERGGELPAADAAASGTWTGGAKRRLSPQEIRDINGELNRLFDADLNEYVSLAQRLATENVLSPADLATCLQAARSKAQTSSFASLAAPGSSNVDRNILAQVLQGKQDVSALAAAAAAAAASGPEGARVAWDEALQVGKYGAWATKAKAWAADDIAARREKGQQISPEQEAALVCLWDNPLSYDAAAGLWHQYAEKAGAVSAPSLADVISADQAIQAAKAAAAADPASLPAVKATAEKAAQVQEAVKKLYLGFAARQGSTSGAVTVDGVPLPFADVVKANAELDVASPAALAAAFQPLELGELLACHWEAVSRTFMWEDMYQLMLETAKEIEVNGA
uniref:mS115 n=1 Tax=Polytomella magna TaxID=353565 RepID=UPI002240E39E|nr:Chain Yj, mS115 [Polytomella magna]8APN_Yj Chain Yj, mS115 [Polytomella magna]8APO_Yj Chain Yj, mS115 [Polytomella magna]